MSKIFCPSCQKMAEHFPFDNPLVEGETNHFCAECKTEVARTSNNATKEYVIPRLWSNDKQQENN